MVNKISYDPLVNKYRLVFFNFPYLNNPVLLMECVHREGINLYKKWHKKTFGCVDADYRVDRQEKYSKQWVIGI